MPALLWTSPYYLKLAITYFAMYEQGMTQPADPSLKRLSLLAFIVVGTVIFLLLKWAAVPDREPPSRSLFSGIVQK